ncbi:MAG: hypothetical protein HQL68_00345 [Magnetococcales bacterium]|nr:hypothetical protein [Magnetococcales bacterium]
MPRRLEISAAMIAIFILSVMIVQSLKLATASLYTVDATLQMESWQKQKKSPSLQQWLKAHQRLQKAIELEPENPLHSTKMAELLQIITTLEKSTKKERNRRSLPHLRRTVNLRPAWAYGWAKLALAKYRAQELDHEMRKAAINAFIAAPNDNPIRRTIRIIQHKNSSKY